MFKEVTIVLLSDMNPQFNWDLNWPVASEKTQAFESSEDLLKYLHIITSYIDAIAYNRGHDKGNLLALPVHYRLLPRGAVTEVLGDVRLEHIKALAKVLSDYYEIDQSLLSYWVLGEESEVTLTKAQEVEMLFYNHEVNQHREARQYRSISAIKAGRVIKPAKAKSVVSDSPLMKLLGATDSLSSWFEKPTCKVIVLGEEVGDQVIHPLQEVLVNMLESGKASRVRVVSQYQERVYSANLFDRLWQKARLAFESRQYS